MDKITRVIALVFCLFLTVLGCTGGSGGGDGTLTLWLTDAPACGFDQVNITVSKIGVHQSASADENETGWSELILTPPKRINLLTLTDGVLEELGQTALQPGQYTQLRLFLQPNSQSEPFNNSVLPSGGDEESIDTPSGVESGIKLIHEFDVEEGLQVDLVLDFDACESIVNQGNGGYLLKPVISITPINANNITTPTT